MAERPDPDTDWATLADRLWATTDMMYDHEAMVDDVTAGDLRAAADGLRQLAAITAERDQLRAERTQLTGDSMTDLKMTYAYEAGHEDGKAEVREQLDAITAAIGDPDELRWHRWHCEATGGGDDLRELLVRIADAAAATQETT